MTAKGSYPALTDLMAFFVTSNERWVIIGQFNNFLRCVGNANEFTALFDIDDSTMIRMWAFEELIKWLTNHYVVENYTEAQQGANITISFTVPGVGNFQGINSVKVEALATACLNLLAV